MLPLFLARGEQVPAVLPSFFKWELRLLYVKKRYLRFW
jgi:hypothetical protein